MSDKIYLTRMTRELAEAYFKEFCYDPAIFLEGQPAAQYIYSAEWLDAYFMRRQGCVHLAIMRFTKPIGEILFKKIDTTAGSAVFSIHLQNDSVKGKGYGTRAAELAVEYAFHVLRLNTIFADAVKRNARSIYVLKKVGFRPICEDERFSYFVIKAPVEKDNDESRF